MRSAGRSPASSIFSPYPTVTEARIIWGDNATHLPTFDDDEFDHVITDPPYSAHTHSKGRRGCTDYAERAQSRKAEFNRNRELGFEPITVATMARCATQFARIAKRWTIVFSDDASAHDWRVALTDAGLELVRTMVWIKVGCAPQFTGDRPAAGHELMLLAHRPGKKRWNGGGKHGVYTCPIVLNRGGKKERLHTTMKPSQLMEALIRDFTSPGERILDPFAGSGSTIAAAKRLGRNGVGIERDESYATLATVRVHNVREQTELFG